MADQSTRLLVPGVRTAETTQSIWHKNRFSALDRSNVCGNTVVTFFDDGTYVRRSLDEVRADVEQTATALGVTAAHTVALLGDASYSWYVHDLALSLTGAHIVALPTLLPPMELRKLIASLDCDIDLFLVDSADRLPPTIDGTVSLLSATRKARVATHRYATRPQDLHTTVWSSSTTSAEGAKRLGMSKAGTNYNLMAFQAAFDLRPDDHVFTFLPFHYQQRMIYYGCCAIGMSFSYAPPSVMFSAMRRLEPSVIIAPPAFYDSVYRQLVATPGLRTEQIFGSRIRLLVTGMARANTAVIEYFEQEGILLLEAYGSNEAGVIAANRESDRKIGTVGKPLPGRDVMIAGDGEIVVSGAPMQTCRGHFPDGDGADARIVGDDLYTGDVGYLDQDGYLVVQGRKKTTLINRNGEKLQPELLESHLCSALAGIGYAVAYLEDGGALGLILSTTAEPDSLRLKARDCLKLYLGPRWAVGSVVVTNDKFTIDNGCLNGSLKVARSAVIQRYAVPSS